MLKDLMILCKNTCVLLQESYNTFVLLSSFLNVIIYRLMNTSYFILYSSIVVWSYVCVISSDIVFKSKWQKNCLTFKVFNIMLMLWSSNITLLLLWYNSTWIGFVLVIETYITKIIQKTFLLIIIITISSAFRSTLASSVKLTVITVLGTKILIWGIRQDLLIMGLGYQIKPCF